MRGNSCWDERHKKQWRGLPKEVGPREGRGGRRPGLPEGIGGFHTSGRGRLSVWRP